jgi:hypothetical protein
LRATTQAPPNPLNPSGAKSYLSPEMFVQFKGMMAIEDTYSTQEAACLDVTTIDKLVTLEYDLFKCPHDMATRKGGPASCMPYLTRTGLMHYFFFAAVRNPVSTTISWHIAHMLIE